MLAQPHHQDSGVTSYQVSVLLKKKKKLSYQKLSPEKGEEPVLLCLEKWERAKNAKCHSYLLERREE